MESNLPLIDIRALEDDAVEKYAECPKHLTIVRHANHEDDSEFHCVLIDIVGPQKPGRSNPLIRTFTVPGQEVIMAFDSTFGRFSIIRVMNVDSCAEYALVTSTYNRMGFLLPLNKLPGQFFATEEAA